MVMRVVVVVLAVLDVFERDAVVTAMQMPHMPGHSAAMMEPNRACVQTSKGYVVQTTASSNAHCCMGGVVDVKSQSVPSNPTVHSQTNRSVPNRLSSSSPEPEPINSSTGISVHIPPFLHGCEQFITSKVLFVVGSVGVVLVMVVVTVVVLTVVLVANGVVVGPVMHPPHNVGHLNVIMEPPIGSVQSSSVNVRHTTVSSVVHCGIALDVVPEDVRETVRVVWTTDVVVTASVTGAGAGVGAGVGTGVVFALEVVIGSASVMCSVVDVEFSGIVRGPQAGDAT